MKVSPIRFAERNGKVEFNASGVSHVGPNRFAFVDNEDPTALFELTLADDGTQAEPIWRRPLAGLADGALSDPEGVTRIDVDGATMLVITSSLALRKKSSRVHDGLVRVRYTVDGELAAEAMPGFRDWMLAAHPELGDAGSRLTDKGGLNIEGLSWDPARSTLLFGLRSPVSDGLAWVLCAQLDSAAPWTTAALTKLPPVRLQTNSKVPQGIRAITYDHAGGGYLVLLGRATSGDDVPFELCTWDGVATATQPLDYRFPDSMKPEGATIFDDGGQRRLLVVGDSGCFATLSL